MAFGKSTFGKQFKWYLVVIYVALIGLVILGFFTDIFETREAGAVPQLAWVIGAAVVLIAVTAIVSKIFKIVDTLAVNSGKLEKLAGALEKNYGVLSQISQNTRLSDKAKAITFRDADRQALREVVFDKLQQQDFETTDQIIDEIAHNTIYTGLAKQLREEAVRYRNATDTERENQVIAHIEKLFENYQWAKSSVLIERLIVAAPNSSEAKGLRQKLLDKKAERKKMLLAAWDSAVQRQATDRSLEILRELDSYLTPNEGLALQEAAKDVFRTKLHNLGVRFSLAVSGKQWEQAVKIGEQIVHDFPIAGWVRKSVNAWTFLNKKLIRRREIIHGGIGRFVTRPL